MDNFLDNATIGAFAQAAGVGVETIRFYQRKGLLPQPPRPQGGIRRWRTWRRSSRCWPAWSTAAPPAPAESTAPSSLRYGVRPFPRPLLPRGGLRSDFTPL